MAFRKQETVQSIYTQINQAGKCSANVSSSGQTWWELLGDLVGRGGSPLRALDAVDVLHHGLGHTESLLIEDMTLAFFPLL